MSNDEPRFRLVEHDPRWETEGYPNALIKALDRYPSQSLVVSACAALVVLSALIAITGSTLESLLIAILVPVAIGAILLLVHRE